MILEIHKEILKDFFRLLFSKKDFFKLDSAERREVIEKELSVYPLQFKKYINSLEEDSFYSEETVSIKGDIPESFKKYYSEFLKEYFLKQIESLNSYHFKDNKEYFSKSTNLTGFLEKLVSNSSKKELIELIENEIKELNITNILKITTPYKLNENNKKQIKSMFKDSVVLLKTDEGVLGGMKLLEDGTLYDYSFSNLFKL